MKIQIVFSEPTGWLGKFVRLCIGGKFSHVHFLINVRHNVWTYEAFPPNIRLVQTDLYLSSENKEVIDLTISEEEFYMILENAVETIQSCHYGIDDSIRIFVRNRISKKFARKLGAIMQDPHSETCSTLAVKTLRLLQKNFGGKDALDFSPDEVYYALKNEYLNMK